MLPALVGKHSLSLTKDDYYGTYLGLNEPTCAATLFRECTAIHKPALFPGVVKFVKTAGALYRLAIATGGWREQVDHALHRRAIERNFAVVVSADDVATGTLNPAIYDATLNRMLKKSASSVLASFRPSTLRRSFSEIGNTGRAFPFAKIYPMGERPTRSAVCTSSTLHSLRPCWTTFLSILRECSPVVPHVQTIEVLACQHSFSAAC